MQVNGITHGSPTSGHGPVKRPEPNVPRSTRPEDEAAPGDLSRVEKATDANDETRTRPSALTTDDISKVVDLANELAQRLDVKVTFRKSEVSDGYQLEVVNRETGEVIRRVPPEKVIAHLENFSGFEGLLTRSGG